jgi:flagellar biosynthesis protein FlhB
VSGRTEAPTPRRLAEARRRGEVAVSRELTGVAALAAGAAVLATGGTALVQGLAAVVRRGLALALDPATPPAAALGAAAADVARLAAPPALAAFGAALLAGALQAGFLLAPGAAAPRLERLDPARGLARLASRERLLSIGLGVVKALLVAAAVAGVARTAAAALAALPRAVDPGGALPRLLAPLAGRLLLVLGALGAADLLVVRRRHHRALRMTRQEVRREQKEDEGDPRHRAERRRRHRALLAAAPVARATCLVVNPTHVAVALLHRREEAEAPRVLAKGTGAAARRLRSEARRAGVPILRDPPLARALHRLAEVGDEIPEELYDAAAAVLAHLYGAPAPETP